MSLTEGISGVKAKKFFAEMLFSLLEKVSKVVPNWQEQLEEMVISLYLHNMETEGTNKPNVANINSFLRWIGFNPIEVKWDEEMKMGKIFFAENVLWAADPQKDPILRLIIKSLTKAIGRDLLKTEPHIVFVDTDKLPPRYKVGLRFVDKAEAISSKVAGELETTQLTLGNSVFEPIMGAGIEPEAAAKAFQDAGIELARKNYPAEWENLGSELIEVPSKLMLFLYKKASIESALRDVGNQLGTLIAEKLKAKYPGAKPHRLVKGIGLMPVAQITDLMSYGNSNLCNRTKNVDFCVFMSYIWEAIISSLLGVKFTAEAPLCATGTSQVCIYTFKKQTA